MISRGIIIGKIIDDLSLLEFQISARNKLGQFDLTKVCEDFFREILNIVYDLKLVNLNSNRSNVPGLDLGDETNKIAFQVTTQRTSDKINETLKAITDDQLKKYPKVKLMLIGKKQSSYSIVKGLEDRTGFKVEEDIVDIIKLLRDTVILDIDKLTSLANLFKTEFRTVKVDLEPVDKDGNFESSNFNSSEQRPVSPPKNAEKFLDKGDKDYEKDLADLIKLYDKLANVPKSTREIIFFIVDRGKYNYSFKGNFRINPKILEKVFNYSESDLLNELNILEEEGLVTTTDDFVDERRVWYFSIYSSMLNELLHWMKEQGLPIRTILNTMDFTILDK